MDIGAFVPLGAFNADPAFLRTLGPSLEERGFESVWLPEHVVLFDDYESRYPYAADGRFPAGAESGMLEPLTALTYIAAVTDALRLGTGICLVPQRNPVYTAKQVADLDVLSGGRAEFGVGIGWLREEFEALGMPFAHRGARTDDHLAVMRSLWDDDTSAYEGALYTLRECRMYPKPVQRPHPPIHVGGESDAAMRRAARVGQGWYGFDRTPDDVLEALGRLDPILAEAGRRRGDDFTVTVCPYTKPIDRGDVERYAELGVDRLVVMVLAFGPDDLLPTLDALAGDVVEPAGAF
jgi:probable F420-dependent oxidoreductase